MAEIEDWEMKDLHILCLSMFCEFLGNSRIWAFCYKNWKASPDHLTIRFMILSFRCPHWLNQCIRSPVNANYFLIPSKEQTARPDCSPWSCEDLTWTQSVCVILMRTIGIKYDEIFIGISLVLSPCWNVCLNIKCLLKILDFKLQLCWNSKFSCK